MTTTPASPRPLDAAWVRDAARTADPLAVYCRDCSASPGSSCSVQTRPRRGMEGSVTTIRRGRAPHDTRVHDAYWEAIAAAITAYLDNVDAVIITREMLLTSPHTVLADFARHRPAHR